MRKVWHEEAWEEYLAWQGADRKTLKRINQLLQSIERNGYACLGKPEPLKPTWLAGGASASTMPTAWYSASRATASKSFPAKAITLERRAFGAGEKLKG